MLRDVIIYYGVYKGMLDRICKRKRINNYMVMPDTVRRLKTEQEISKYEMTWICSIYSSVASILSRVACVFIYNISLNLPPNFTHFKDCIFFT